VVDVGWVNGLAAIRSLGRAGAPVLALDHRPSALGFRSRYAQARICPDPQDEGAFVDFLATLGKELEAPVPVFPTHDEPLNAIARAGLGEPFRFPFPPWEVLARIQSKRAQLEAAEAVGIAVPRTIVPGSATEARAAADELGYPVLVKPSSTEGFKRRFGRQAFRCETADEAAQAYADAEEYEPLVQEVVPGGDGTLFTLGSYLAADGEPLGLFCGRKLRQTPPGVGTCRVGEAVWDEEVVEQGLRLLKTLGHVGLSQVELKRDARDGALRLMEVNPRLWQWHGLAAACGVDVTRIAYEDLTGARPAPANMNGRRRRWAITLLAGERPALQRPPYVDAVFAHDDLRPALVQAARLVRR
jgi:D-aspartate ligase